MKMLSMVFVVLLSVTVLRKKYSIIQYLAVGLIMAGLLFVTYIDVYGPSSLASGSLAEDSAVA